MVAVVLVASNVRQIRKYEVGVPYEELALLIEHVYPLLISV